jgi:hypothetical protein
MGQPWIGVDLDGTLAHYDDDDTIERIGKPIPQMLMHVNQWLRRGIKVKIFTARAVHGKKQIDLIQDWCEKNGLGRLEVTCSKDMDMFLLYDDRAYRVVTNTGEISM